jgi:oligopeptide transport system substrate-binding protein
VVLAEKLDLTRRGFLVKSGSAGVAGAAALSLSGTAALAAPLEQNADHLRLVWTLGEPENVDPQKSSFINEIEVIMRVYRNLLQFDSAGTIIPDQAEALPQVAENGTLLTFTLKPGLTYSDGRPLTAKDYEFAWKRHMDPRTKGQYAFLGYIISGGEALNQADPTKVSAEQISQLRDALGVKALDDRTLQIKTTAPAPWFMSVLTTWCGVPTRQDLIMSGNGGEEFGSKWVQPQFYVGNGPYVWSAYDQEVRWTFTANDRYSGGKPPIGTVTRTIIKEQAVAFAAYQNNEIDVVGVLSENRPQVDADPNLRAQFFQYADPLTTWIAFSSTKPPFNNQKVRAAFAAAYDRVSYVRNIEGGQGIPARQLIPPGFPGYYEFELEEQVYNPDIARRLLAEAGFPNGQGLAPIKFVYTSTAASKRRAEAQAEIFKQTLGINIELEGVESRARTAMRKDVNQYPQMTPAGWHQDYADPQNWYSTVFNSKNPVDKTGWKNTEFDRITDAADVELDPQRRLDLYRQAAQIFINDAPVVFSHYNVIWLLVKPRVQNFKPFPLEFFFGELNLYNMRLAS